MVLQALAILEQCDLRALEHNSADYLHLVIEAIKLAFADREQFYGDPEQIRVPIDELLSDEYARRRASLIDVNQANAELRPGDPDSMQAELPIHQRLGGAPWGPGTIHIDVIDGEGNMAAFTASGG